MEEPPEPEEWAFKGEGNANIVFAYCGTDPDLVSPRDSGGRVACGSCMCLISGYTGQSQPYDACRANRIETRARGAARRSTATAALRSRLRHRAAHAPLPLILCCTQTHYNNQHHKTAGRQGAAPEEGAPKGPRRRARRRRRARGAGERERAISVEASVFAPPPRLAAAAPPPRSNPVLRS